MLKYIVTSFQKLDWSVNRKIGICLAIPVFIIVVSSIVVFFAIQSLQSSMAVERQKSKGLENIQTFNQSLRTVLNVYNDVLYLNQVKASVNKFYQNETDKALTIIKQDSSVNPTSQDNITTIKDNYAKLLGVFSEVNSFIQNGDVEQAVSSWASSFEVRRNITNDTTQLQKEFEQEKQVAIYNSQFSVHLTLLSAGLAGILTLIAALLSGYLLSATIGRPLAATRSFLEMTVNRDLSSQLNLANRDELGDLARALNMSVKTLRGIVESFNIGAEVESAAQNLYQVSLEQTDQADEQVDLLKQITVAVQELASAATNVSNNARTVANVSGHTLDGAQQVNTVTSEVSQLMQELQNIIEETDQAIVKANEDFTRLQEQLQEAEAQNRNSQKIVNIMANIAREIHLLSLNAAIEAAGAGQFGDRFSVVAREIKELANSSAYSAEQVTGLLLKAHISIQSTTEQSEQSQGSINRVVKLSNKIRTLAEETFSCTQRNHQAVEQILAAATDSTNQANQIKIATSQQQVASQQVFQTITALNYSVITSANRTNEVANTSTQLNNMSKTLSKKLAELKLPLAS